MIRAVVVSLLFGGAFAALLPLFTLPLQRLWVRYRQAKRKAALEGQIDVSLRSIAQTLKATSSLIDAFETVATEVSAPMAEELALVVAEHRLGASFDEALCRMAQRVNSRNLNAVVMALTIGRQTGGNLPQILHQVAATLRERMRLEVFIEAKTAEGKAQAWIMGAMPLVLGTLVYWVEPSFLRPLFVDPLGWAILLVIVLLMVGGVHCVRKVSTVDV